MKAISLLGVVIFAIAAIASYLAADPALAAGVLLAEGAVALDPEKIKAELSRISDQVKGFAEDAMKQIKASGKMSEETRASVDQLLTKQGELNARLQTAEQILAKYESGAFGGGGDAPQTMGEQVAASDEFQAWAPRAGKGMKLSMSVRAAITHDTGSAGGLAQPTRVPGIVAPNQQRLFVRDLLSWGRTGSNAIEFVQETGFDNQAAVVSENPANGKPESDLTFELKSAPVATIAHWVHASRQVLSDVQQLQGHIDGRLRYGLKLVEEQQLLKGSGVGLNLTGIYTLASAYANPGVTVQAETRMDRIRLALLQAELAEFYSDGIVLHPIDWAAIELTKTEENAYLFANPRQIAVPALWGRPVVPTQSLDAGEFLVGSFQQGAQGWDREDVSLMISLEDRDNFIKNMVTLLVEERVGLAVYRPEAFVKGDFDDLDSTV